MQIVMQDIKWEKETEAQKNEHHLVGAKYTQIIRNLVD